MFEKFISVCRVQILSAILVTMFVVPSNSAPTGDPVATTPAEPSNSAPTGDLMYYYNLALKNDPQLRGTEYESLATRETLQQAYAGVLPKLSSELGYMLTNQTINSSDNQVYAEGKTDYDTMTYGVKLVQPLFSYALYLRLGQAESILNRSDLELEKARQDLALRAAEAYMSVLLSKDELVAVQAEEAAVEQHHLLAKERCENGMAPITDLYDTEARLAAVGAQRVDAENVLNDAFQALTEICGIPAQEIRPLKDEIPLTQPIPENIDSWTETGLAKNLDIQIQKIKTEIAAKEVDRQGAAHYPTADFEFDYNNKDTKGSLFGGGSNTTTYDYGVRLSIPLYEGGLVSSRKAEAISLHQSALQGVTKQNRNTERLVRSTYNGVVSAINRVAAMEKSVNAQKLVVEAKEEGFKAGLYISLALLDAMQDLYKYKREYAKARNDYILNSLRLKHAVGALNQDEIVMLNAWLQD